MNKKQVLAILGFVAALAAALASVVERLPDAAPTVPAPAASVADAGSP